MNLSTGPCYVTLYFIDGHFLVGIKRYFNINKGKKSLHIRNFFNILVFGVYIAL